MRRRNLLRRLSSGSSVPPQKPGELRKKLQLKCAEHIVDGYQLVEGYRLFVLARETRSCERQLRPLLRAMVASPANIVFNGFASQIVSGGHHGDLDTALANFLTYRIYWQPYFRELLFNETNKRFGTPPQNAPAHTERAEWELATTLLDYLEMDEHALAKRWSREILIDIFDVLIKRNLDWIKHFNCSFREIARSERERNLFSIGSYVEGERLAQSEAEKDLILSVVLATSLARISDGSKEKKPTIVTTTERIEFRDGIAFFGEKPAPLTGLQDKLLKRLSHVRGPSSYRKALILEIYGEDEITDELIGSRPSELQSEQQEKFIQSHGPRFNQLLRDLEENLKRFGWNWSINLIAHANTRGGPRLTLHPDCITPYREPI